MKYRAGYKYQLAEPETFSLGWNLDSPIITEYICVLRDGTMQLAKGYAWNGANVVPDFRWILRGSAGHDAGYQLIRLGLLPADPWRERFDRLLEVWCIEDKAWTWEAALVYRGVKHFGGPSADPASERLILVVP